jgi:hypothetical protein
MAVTKTSTNIKANASFSLLFNRGTFNYILKLYSPPAIFSTSP